MSIFKVESGAFTYIASIFNGYGIPIEFRQDDSLDLLTEYRRSIRLRMDNSNKFNDILNGYKEATKIPDNKNMHNLGLYSRSAIRKSDTINNNRNLEVISKNYAVDYGLEIRNAFYGEIAFEVTILVDTHEIADLIELTYVYELLNQVKTCELDYIFGPDIEPLEGVGYQLQFSEINSRGNFNTTNMFHIDFSVTLTGLFFLPYYKDSFYLENVVLSVHAFNASTEPTPKNINPDSLVYEKSYPQVQNK